MNLILNIDTSGETASVCLANEEASLQLLSNEGQKDHSSWLHIAIAESLKATGHNINELKAVAVSIGPGSYTGLRIGLSTAKGICFALGIPLITIGTLDMMALAVKKEATDLICPLIDARRMEVFMAVYKLSNGLIGQLLPPQALIIDTNSFAELLSAHHILFCGNGARKLEKIISSKNALFSSTVGNALHVSKLASQKFHKREFTDPAYAEPLYVKEFHRPIPGSFG